jgi:hypothetical protein
MLLTGLKPATVWMWQKKEEKYPVVTIIELENGKTLRSEDSDTSKSLRIATAYVTVYIGANVTAYMGANAARLYKGEEQPSHASRVIAVAGEASPIEVRKVSSSRKRSKSNITSQVIIDKDVIYVDVDNTDNHSSPAEKDVKTTVAGPQKIDKCNL